MAEKRDRLGSPGVRARLRKRCNGKFAPDATPAEKAASERWMVEHLTKKQTRSEESLELHEWATDPRLMPVDHLGVVHLNLSVHPFTAIENCGIVRVADLLEYSAGELVDRANLDGAMLDEITQALGRFEQKLHPPRPRPPEITVDVERLIKTGKENEIEIERLGAIVRDERRRRHQAAEQLEAALEKVEELTATVDSLTAEVGRARNAKQERQQKPRPRPAPPPPAPPTGPDYPRCIFHPALPMVIVNSREEEDALGPEWTRTYRPPAPAAPEPPKLTTEMLADEMQRRFRANLQTTPAYQPFQAAPRPREEELVRKAKQVVADWRELRKSLGYDR